MRKALALLGLLLTGTLWAAPPPYKTMPIGTPGGLNTDEPELTLGGDGQNRDQSPDSQNVITDLGTGLGPRLGYIFLSTEPATDFWVLPHSNGTRFSLVISGSNLKASTGNGIYSIQVSTIPAGQRVAGAALGDTFYFSDATNGIKKVTFSGATPSVSVASATIKATLLASHKGRLWASGISGDERAIRGSEYLVGSNFTLPTSSDPPDTDPVYLTASGALDEPMRALFPFQDKLMFMKDHSFGGIYGSRRSNFAMKIFSEKSGTAYPESIQDCDGELRWLGPARTVWGWDGGVFTDKNLLSAKIDNLLATTSQGDANSRSFTWTSQSDFDRGTNNQTSNSITVGSVVLSTWTATDTTGADFGAGALTNVSTQIVSGDLYLSTNNTNVSNNGFESGSGTDATNWTEFNAAARTLGAGHSGSYSMEVGAIFGIVAGTLEILDYSSSTLATISIPYVTSFTQQTVDLSAYVGRNIRLRFNAPLYTSYAQSDLFFCSGSTVSFWVVYDVASSGNVFVDDVEGGRSTTLTGTFTSQSFNTVLSSPAWQASAVTDNTNGNLLTYQTQSSADGVSWDTAVSLTTGSAPTSARKRYFRYLVSFATATAGTGLPYLSEATFSARNSTGSWVSDSAPTTGMSSQGVFTAVESLNSGAITYGVYSDTDAVRTVTNGVPVVGTFVASQTITSGSIPTLSTCAYMFVSAYETITASTQAPAVNAVTLNWATGNTLRTASAYINQRYWLAVAVSSTSNNRVLVYDRNREWQLYSGINAAAMGIYNSVLYFGNSSGIFEGDMGTTDNGTAITSYYRTPAYFPSEDVDSGVTFNNLRLTTTNSAATLTTSFRINGIETDYDLGDRDMDVTDGFQNFSLPFSSSEVRRGKYVGFRFGVTSTTDWRILAGKLYLVPDVEPR